MPKIPESKHRPNLDETIVDLLESIAMEEMAISHIMNAEGEKLQALVKSYDECEICHCQLQESCESMTDMMNTMIMKEWLLVSKLNNFMKIKDKLGQIMMNVQKIVTRIKNN